MDLPWGDEKTRKFVTNVGLITSNGPHGHNIMSAEWTHHLSYSPGLIAIAIGRGKATHENITHSREFGISLAAKEQNIVASVAGMSSGKDVNKVEALKELGVEFYKAKKTGVLMVKGAALNVECTLHKALELGDHTLFVGEVVEATAGKEPLAYHGGTYWQLTEQIEKPGQKELERIAAVVERHRKK